MNNIPVNICDGVNSRKKRNQKQKNENKKYLARQVFGSSNFSRAKYFWFLFFCF